MLPKLIFYTATYIYKDFTCTNMYSFSHGYITHDDNRPWVDENCGQNAEKIVDIWIFIVSNTCCHLLDAGCNIDNSSSVFSDAR